MAGAVRSATLWPDLIDWPAMRSNADVLRALMVKHGMTRPNVYGLLEISRATLNSWLAPPESPSHRPMPNNMLRLLRLELGEATPSLPVFTTRPRSRRRA